MGNLTKALKENEHLKRQNQVLRESVIKVRRELEQRKNDGDAAVDQLTQLIYSYIGAIALRDGQIFIASEDIKKVINEYDMELSIEEDGYTFKLVPKCKEESDG